ncbi:MAG: sulfurtransferase, partial [Deltaproteobacteria bacterium]|nr:sulfurtransferase [Deltaproteobacteria bacterium]
MYSQILYSAFEVQECLSRGEAVMIDVRDPDAFQQAHIPGAVNVPEVFSYLATSTPEGLAEMHATFEGLFARAGIASSKKVFFYEGNLHELYGGSCRGYWLLRYFGHSAAAILDGGLAAWQAKGFPLEKGAADCTPAAFAVQPLPEMIATKADVLDALQSSDV